MRSSGATTVFEAALQFRSSLDPHRLVLDHFRKQVRKCRKGHIMIWLTHQCFAYCPNNYR